MGRVVFRVILEIVLVGDKTLTEISRQEVIFWVLSCIASSGLGGNVKVMLRCGDVSEYDCGSCVFCLGLTIRVGSLTNWVVADVSVCDAFCAEVIDSGVVYSLALLSFMWNAISSLRFSLWFSKMYSSLLSSSSSLLLSLLVNRFCCSWNFFS